MRSPYWLAFVLCGVFLFRLSPAARAQELESDALVCREDAPEDSGCGDPSAGNDAEADVETLASDPVEEEGTASPAPEGLPAFLLGLHLGPFFSFGGLGGGGVDLDFQFKLHRNSYLGVELGYLGGYQIAKKRSDSLLIGTLAYRHYFPQAGRRAFSIKAGPALGYYLTGPEDDRPGYDWISFGIRAEGSYHWFLGERFSIGVGVGFGLFHQFSEMQDRAESFTILAPELLLSLTF